MGRCGTCRCAWQGRCRRMTASTARTAAGHPALGTRASPPARTPSAATCVSAPQVRSYSHSNHECQATLRTSSSSLKWRLTGGQTCQGRPGAGMVQLQTSCVLRPDMNRISSPQSDQEIARAQDTTSIVRNHTAEFAVDHRGAALRWLHGQEKGVSSW